MRTIALLLSATIACAPAGEDGVDTSAAAGGTDDRLEAADVAGTWSGTTLAEGSDSVLGGWTTTSTTDSTGYIVFEDSPDTVRSRIRFVADSMIVESDPYVATSIPGRPQLRFVSVGRLRDDRLVGTSVLMLVLPRDSVFRRTRWEAMRAAS